MTLRRRVLFNIGIVLLAVGAFAGQSFSQSTPTSATKNYVIELKDEPVVGRLNRQRPESRFRMQVDGADASVYRSQILDRQAVLRQVIDAMPDARVAAQMDTVFNGMAVALRPEDAAALEANAAVEAVFPSVSYRKALDAALPLIHVPQAWTNSKIGGESLAGVGIRIAIIDTGIDNGHPMFQSGSLTAPGGFPRFTAPGAGCANSDQQYTSAKVIVARNYVSLLDQPDPNCDAADRDGHGTFVAAIAAGRRVMTPFASISGVAPQAFLGSYKVFGTPGVNDQATLGAILKAMDDAVKDGMNVINLSLGASASGVPANDPLDIAVANATEAGVTVAAAAGNAGPGTGTVTSPGTSPLAITVGASTNSRILGEPLLITATVAVPPSVQTVGALPGNGPQPTADIGPVPMVDVASLGDNFSACLPIAAGSLSGKLALIQRGTCGFSVKILNASNAGALAAIIYNNQNNQPPILMDVGSSIAIPSAMIGNAEGISLASLLASPGSGVQALLQSRETAVPSMPNQLASFSADGPSTDLSIKPDLVAPGTSIYSATQSKFPAGDQYDPSGFTISNGTSFSSPMVAGSAALVKQAFPGFTPLQIKSALVNTASKVVSNLSGVPAGAIEDGNGLLDASAALSTPALVSPVSISYGALAPGVASFPARNLTVTNTGAGQDQFSVSVRPLASSEQFVLAVSPSSFSLGPGTSMTVSIAATLTAPAGNVEGVIAIQSRNSQSSVTVPYWGTFLSPNIAQGGVVNAASFGAGPSSLAPGGMISIFGTALTNSPDLALTLPLPLSLGGTILKIGGQTAPLLFVSPIQINAQVPFELDGTSSAEVVVSLNGLSSPPATVRIASSAPGIFTDSQQGTGRGAVLHAADSTPVTLSNPARAGEFLEIFGTGMGTAFPSVATGSAASFPPPSVTIRQPTVMIAGQSVAASFSGLTPGFVGLDQINFQMPVGIPSGNQTLTITSFGVTSNPVTLAVQ